MEGKDYYYCFQESCQAHMKKRGDELEDPDSVEYESVDLVTVGVYSHPYEADLVKGHLESEGVPAFVMNEHLVNLNWLYSNAVGGILVQVAEQDAEKAKEILSAPASDDIETLVPEDDPEQICPACGSGETQYVDLASPRLTYLSWLLLNIPLFRPRKRMKCLKCNRMWKLKD